MSLGPLLMLEQGLSVGQQRQWSQYLGRFRAEREASLHGLDAWKGRMCGEWNYRWSQRCLYQSHELMDQRDAPRLHLVLGVGAIVCQ